MAVQAQHLRKKLYTERIMLRRPGNQAVLTASIQGHVTLGSLESALSVLSHKYPMLWARVVVEEDGSAWLVSDPASGPMVESVPKSSSDDWLAVMANEQRYRYDCETGPLARFVLVRGEATSELVVSCHHLICDGLSLTYLVRDLMLQMESCRGYSEVVAIGPPVNSETVEYDSRGGRFARAIVRLVNWLWRKHPVRPGHEDFERLDELYWSDKAPRILAWTLQESDVDCLVRRSREAGVTVHSALCTAFLLAQEKTENATAEHSHRIHIPVSIRERIRVPVGEAFGFYASPIVVEFPRLVGMPFWEAARLVHLRIKQRLTDQHVFRLLRINSVDPLLVDCLYLAKFGLILSRVADIVVRSMALDRPLAALAITNLGAVRIPTEYGGLRLKGLFGPTVFSDLLDKVVGVATIGGTMCFTVVFDMNVLDVATVERVRDLAMNILREAASGDCLEGSSG